MDNFENPFSEKDRAPRADWAQLAQNALDLWQAHLTALANDATAKDEMARLVAPFSQMFMNWASMLQGAGGRSGFEHGPRSDDMAPSTFSSSSESNPIPLQQQGACHRESNPVPPLNEPPPKISAEAKEEPCAPSFQDMAAPHGPSPIVSERSTDRPTARPTPRRRAPPADGVGDLAELASRLAKFEREMEALRAGSRDGGGAPQKLAEDPDSAPAHGNDGRLSRARP